MTKQNTQAKNESGAATDTTSPSATATVNDTASPAVESTLEAARKARADQMSISGNKGAKSGTAKGGEGSTAKAEKKPAFVSDTALLTTLRGLTDAELLERAKDSMRPVDFNNHDVYAFTGNTKDGLNGQEITRSGIRNEVVEFLKTRPDHQAPANVIVAYMLLGAGKVYKGKFDFGYITTKDPEDAKRGMIARNFLKLAAKGAVPEVAPEAAAA